MSILVKGNQFHLQTANSSYILASYKDKYLAHLYWGARLSDEALLSPYLDDLIFSRPNSFHYPLDANNTSFLSDVPLEFSVAGRSDFRTPSMQVQNPDGSSVVELCYAGYRVIAGKPPLEGLPAVYCETGDDAQTLEIMLTDKLTGLWVYLDYTVMAAHDTVCRSARCENKGDKAIHLLDFKTACVDFYGTNYKLLNLWGDWARERQVEFVDICHGVQLFDSKRGMTGHMHAPFLALCDKKTDEANGAVYALSLVYSGSFMAFAEGTAMGTTRVGIGINPFGFDWPLEPGGVFQAPEAVMVFSAHGLGGMSRILHRVIRERLCRGVHRDKVRPVVINNWEGTYYHFDQEKLLAIARVGAQMGAECFVVDDGWFGRRDDDSSSLGDWQVNPAKLPDGLKGLADQIHGLGLGFGLWLEPEMVSPDSELYRAHPDWCLHAEGRARTEQRHQLVLDLSREDVAAYLLSMLTALLSSTDINYVKWDCNRHINETSSPAQAHRYMLGLYRLLGALTKRFPQVLIEGCSGGGGRFDLGMLAYMPQTWTSDDTNPIARLSIQYGTSMLFPPLTMGAHIGNMEFGSAEDSPLLNTAAHVAMAGNFGIELDATKLTPAQRQTLTAYIAQYKTLRLAIQHGDFYRLESPFTGSFVSWLFVDENLAVLFVYQTRRQLNGPERRVLLQGLQANAHYRLGDRVYTGETLMCYGLRIPLSGYEYASDCLIFKKIEESI